MQSFLNTSGAFSDASEVIPAVARWTLQDLANKRLPETQLASEKAMKKYQRGEPSDTLYVKNLAKTVELADLFAVFGAVLAPESGLEYDALAGCQWYIRKESISLTLTFLLYSSVMQYSKYPSFHCGPNEVSGIREIPHSSTCIKRITPSAWCRAKR